MQKNLFFSVILIATSCVPKASDESERDALAAKQQQPPVTARTNGLLNNVFGSDSGIFRGFEWGDEMATIEQTETLEQFEKISNRLGYSLETEHYEMVDVQYSFDEDSGLSEIRVDMFLNSDSSQTQVQEALVKYLTQQFGHPKVLIDSTIWQSDKRTELSLKKIETKLDKGLQLSYRKMD